MRIEGEASYRQLKIEDASLESLKESVGVESGDMKALNLMVNVWFDIDIGGGFRPYLGGGVGGGQLTLDTATEITLGAIKTPDTPQKFDDRSAWAFAYQVGGGVGFDLVAGLTLSLGYRLSGTTTAELAWNAVGSGSDEILRTGTLHHSLDLGLRYEIFWGEPYLALDRGSGGCHAGGAGAAVVGEGRTSATAARNTSQ